jgi:hypothetical protein
MNRNRYLAVDSSELVNVYLYGCVLAAQALSGKFYKLFVGQLLDQGLKQFWGHHIEGGSVMAQDGHGLFTCSAQDLRWIFFELAHADRKVGVNSIHF